jgi:hypothetical protein
VNSHASKVDSEYLRNYGFFLKAHAALFQSTHYEQLQDEFEPSALLAHERRGVDFKRGKQTLKSLHSPF